MSYIVTEKCIKCKFTDCVNVCPVDCFHEGENFLVINPENCIDCAICVPECPVNAIKLMGEKPSLFNSINLEFSKIWPIIYKSTFIKISQNWETIKNKLHLIKV